MKYEDVLDFCGRPAKRLILKSLKPGDKVYRYDGCSAYTPGDVTKGTFTGQVTVEFTCGSSIFLPTGRERGVSKYNNSRLDVDMTFAERTKWLAARERSKAAATAINAIEVKRVKYEWGKSDLAAEVARLQELLDAARALVEAI